MKKIILAIIAVQIPASFFVEGNGPSAPPIAVRLSRFESTFRKVVENKEKQVVQTIIMSEKREYTVLWDAEGFKNPPKENHRQAFSSDELAKIASDFIRRSLDKDLLVGKLEPISTMRFRITNEFDDVTFFEYLVDDKSPLAGEGFGRTVVIPVSASGKIVCKIKSSKI